jgi:PAS domain S-box-containing protein
MNPEASRERDLGDRLRRLAWLRNRTPLAWVLRYGLAVAAAAAALGLRLALTAWFGPGLPTYITFYPAVMAAALLAGLGPGLVATVLADFAVGYCVLTPGGQFAIATPVERVGLVIFTSMGLFMSVVAELYRRYRHKAAGEAAVRESQARLATFAEATFEGIVESEAGTIVDCNEQFARMVGYSVAALRGVETSALIAPEDRDRVMSNILQGRQSAIEYVMLRKDGTRIFVEVHGRPLSPGSTRRHTAVRDITERKQAEQQLREANERYELVLAGAEAGIWDWDVPRHKVVFSSPWKAMRGFAEHEISDAEEEWSRTIHPDDAPRVMAAVQAHFEGKTPVFAEEYRVRRKDGSWMWIADRGLARRDANGRVVRMAGSETDITELKRAEEALRNSEKLYRAIGESINYGIWVCAPDGRNIYASESFLKLVGLTQEQCSNFGWGDVLHSDDAERTIAAWKECVRTGGTWDIEHRFRGVDGQWHAVLARGVPVRDDRGTIIYWAGINLDIDRLKQAEEGLRSVAAELSRSNQDLEQFAYVSSHDLQEPLRMVASFSGILRDRYADKLDDKGKEYLGFVMEGAHRMQSLVEGLLQYSRIGTRGNPPEPMDVQRAVDAALANLRASIEESGAAITTGPLPSIRAERTQMTQLFQNLIGNAIKFRSDRPPEIHVGAERQDRSWLFWVKDNGIGIDPKFKDKIFVIFQRLHARDKYPGTGIGLAVCKKIVERHGGEIRVESQPGQGSTFLFTIPDVHEAR